MKKTTTFFLVTLIFIQFTILITDTAYTQPTDSLYFVKVVSNNADIYQMPNYNTPGIINRLTTHSAIDNHPQVYGNKIVWSSNRPGNFELYYATLPNVEATAQRITTNTYSDRHPHFSHNGEYIIYTAKYRFETSTVCPKSECSIPVHDPCGWYEGLRIIKISTWTIYDIDFRNMPINGGGTWPGNFATWIGHPSFSHNDNKIIFTAALDENGTTWEVFSVDYTVPNVVSNLKRHTQGTVYPNPPNPIQMSGGAVFSEDSDSIYYSSTRTPLGNSQIYKIPYTSINAPVHPINQITWNYGNDYVPEPLDVGKFVITSDLGAPIICGPPDTGASQDLDLFIMDLDGANRTNLTDNDTEDEMLLIGDEVSWFCGLSPNLSECRDYPKIWNVCWFKEFYRMGTEPTYLPLFPKRDIYTRAFQIVSQYMILHNNAYWMQMLNAMNANWSNCNVSWMNVQSWWMVPSLFDQRWNTLIARSPALITPPNKTEINDCCILFEWSNISEATSYGFQVSDMPDFLSPIINVTGLSSPSYSDSIPNNGRYYWRASATNSAGTSWSTIYYFDILITGIKTIGSEIPEEYTLYPNYPNPFNPSTEIRFDIPNSTFTKLTIYDISGREVAVLVNEKLHPGKYKVSWDGTNYSSGVYFYSIESGNYIKSKKMVLLK